MIRELALVAGLLASNVEVAETQTTAVRQMNFTPFHGPPQYIIGDCDSLKDLFSWYGMTQDESAFFFGRGIIKRESDCGRDTYNERTGDTSVCQINGVHSQDGYFFGVYYPTGWTEFIFHVQAGRPIGESYKDDPNFIPACLWLLRGGTLVPGKLNTSPWETS